MKILVIGGTGHVSRLVSTSCAREEWTYESSRASALGPGRCVAKPSWRSAIGDLTNPPAIEAAFKAVEKMFLLNAVNARAHAGVGRIRVDAASRHSSRDLLLDFPGQPVPQRSAFRRQGGSGARLTGSRTRDAPRRGVRQRNPPLVPAAAQEVQRSQSECRVGDRMTPRGRNYDLDDEQQPQL